MQYTSKSSRPRVHDRVVLVHHRDDPAPHEPVQRAARLLPRAGVLEVRDGDEQLRHLASKRGGSLASPSDRVLHASPPPKKCCTCLISLCTCAADNVLESCITKRFRLQSILELKGIPDLPRVFPRDLRAVDAEELLIERHQLALARGTRLALLFRLRERRGYAVQRNLGARGIFSSVPGATW